MLAILIFQNCLCFAQALYRWKDTDVSFLRNFTEVDSHFSGGSYDDLSEPSSGRQILTDFQNLTCEAQVRCS
ncbi:hypothetical protein RchiOBHm_Chr2g0146981 [Rosa chinensis]|uniref:Uncharacterized protein n=1 Tax=Rosa chinensis TaxID=74649 RepID=A0A2P6RZ13_ROSCH|nr:hypothetical protein RchiOBHm_Chr2g0146981 [Rosa chinensis]